jgi:hypothetical protein
VYCLTSGVGVGVCARSAEPIVTTKIKVKNVLSIVEGAEYLRRFFAGGGFRLVSPVRYLAQQWPPEQHLPPPQQSAAGEVAVAVPIMARAVIIVKRYFIESLLLNSIKSRSRVSEPTRTKDQTRGGGTGGRSDRDDEAMISPKSFSPRSVEKTKGQLETAMSEKQRLQAAQHWRSCDLTGSLPPQ